MTIIVPKLIEEEMKNSYLAYSLSVIIGRALPDVRDGLKPVHRRILYAMRDLGLVHSKPYKKCARIVGEVLGKYHPHGDVAVYDSLVRLAQDFSLRYPLVQGQGNFGCFTKDTKVKLADGRSLSFEDLVKENKEGKRNFTFTVTDTKHITIAEIKNPRRTKTTTELVRVTLDTGESITCTPDHRFMLLDGSYSPAEKLSQGTRLMPMLSAELSGNHKVASVEKIHETADVYDLTIDGTHNFLLDVGIFVHNSLDGDNPASMRYTEARLQKLSEELLVDIEKETVDFVPNFDASLEEPTVLPSVAPNLLINGSTGIAVGMATNIPPHNMKEVCSAVLHLIDHEECTSADLTQHVPGPDFPTGGIIIGGQGLHEAYMTGRGKITVRARTNIEEGKNHQSLIVTEIPYLVNKSTLVEELASLIQEKKVQGVTDLRDESDRDGVRIVLEIKNGTNTDVLTNQLFTHSRLQDTMSIIMLSIVDGGPKILNIKEILTEFINHRKNIIRRRTTHDLRIAKERVHILEGLLMALQHIDAIVELIKKSRSPKIAQEQLRQQYTLSEKQSEAILDMKLQRLTGLEQEKIKGEHTELCTLILELESILASEPKILSIIKEETQKIMETYGDTRRTTILNGSTGIVEEKDLIKPEEVVITVSNAGYVKRLGVDTYRQQRRGGKGVIGAEARDGDHLESVFMANTQDNILCFTSHGKVHWLNAYNIPEAGRYAKGTALANIVQLDKEEKITACLPVKAFNDGIFVFMATSQGIVKKVSLSEFSNPRKGGIAAMTLGEKDTLTHVALTDGTRNILMATKKGMAVRYHENTVRAMGRTAQGVYGIRLREEDEMIGFMVEDERKDVLTITNNGYGKRTAVTEYRLTNRGGIGVTNIKLTEKNGDVIAVLPVEMNEEIILMSKQGVVVRVPVQQISVIGRSTQGVRIMKLSEGDSVVSATVVREDE